MTELSIPPDASDDQSARLVREHVSVGDVVEVRERDRTGSDDPETTGEVTGLETGYLELDGRSLADGSLRYDEIGTVVLVERADE